MKTLTAEIYSPVSKVVADDVVQTVGLTPDSDLVDYMYDSNGKVIQVQTMVVDTIANAMAENISAKTGIASVTIGDLGGSVFNWCSGMWFRDLGWTESIRLPISPAEAEALTLIPDNGGIRLVTDAGDHSSVSYDVIKNLAAPIGTTTRVKAAVRVGNNGGSRFSMSISYGDKCAVIGMYFMDQQVGTSLNTRDADNNYLTFLIDGTMPSAICLVELACDGINPSVLKIDGVVIEAAVGYLIYPRAPGVNICPSAAGRDGSSSIELLDVSVDHE